MEFGDDEQTAAADCYYLRVMQQDGEMAWSSPIWAVPPAWTVEHNVTSCAPVD
jgi:hypothetical protein